MVSDSRPTVIDRLTTSMPSLGTEAAMAYSIVSQRGWSKETDAMGRLFERHVSRDKVNFILALYKEEKEALQVLADAAGVSMTELVMNALEKTYGHYDIPRLKREVAENRRKEEIRQSERPPASSVVHEELRTVPPKGDTLPPRSTMNPGLSSGSIIKRRKAI